MELFSVFLYKIMIEINLIKKRIVIPAQIKESFFLLLTFFLIFFVFSLLVFFSIQATNRKVIANYSRQLEKGKIKRKEAEIKLFFLSEEEKNWGEELKKICVIEKNYFYAPKLTALANFIPSNIYLSRILFEGNNLVLEGRGTSNNGGVVSLANFLKELNKSSSFREGLGKVGLEKMEREEGGTFSFWIKVREE